MNQRNNYEHNLESYRVKCERDELKKKVELFNEFLTELLDNKVLKDKVKTLENENQRLKKIIYEIRNPDIEVAKTYDSTLAKADRTDHDIAVINSWV